jgi:hypothetical protein
MKPFRRWTAIVLHGLDRLVAPEERGMPAEYRVLDPADAARLLRDRQVWWGLLC